MTGPDKYHQFTLSWILKNLRNKDKPVKRRIIKKINDYHNDIIRDRLALKLLTRYKVGLVPTTQLTPIRKIIALIKARRPNWRKLGLGNLMS